MIYRVYVERKEGLDFEAKSLLNECKDNLRIQNIDNIRIYKRYDVDNISEETFNKAVENVFSEPQTDNVYTEINSESANVFAVEFLPGQFDQRADSAAQCIQIMAQCERPIVKSAKVYALYGNLNNEDISKVKNYVINPVEAREATFELPKNLNIEYNEPDKIQTIDGMIYMNFAQLGQLIDKYGLAMDIEDIKCCQQYFREEGRDPSLTEIKVIDTYWSDHCRHTTFGTIIDNVEFEEELVKATYNDYLETRKKVRDNKPVCLMDIATIAVKYLRQNGQLEKLDESEEINACTVKIDVDINGNTEKWLLLFKNETHNHPTEIEPFGGAATCIGGAIRDPLSGRSYVYAAMRVTGAADPTEPVDNTIPGKLPQRKIVTTAAEGYSSYGNQIGLATGIVDELYHPGYKAKRMEIGAVIAAAPAKNVRREKPMPNDVVILLGGSTGRDGIGGATGSSKAHTSKSVENCGAEVQKGNAPEERKLQRMFRNPRASQLIKRCNDFGAGGVSVAIGELADGLQINLNKVPKKYEGLDGTELAISESQERMAVVVAPEDVYEFLNIANDENLQAIPVAEITKEPRLVMSWNGQRIVDISRNFLDLNGADKHIKVSVKKGNCFSKKIPDSFCQGYMALAQDLNVCSKRGLSERFDSTIGAGTVLMPFGGKHQHTPIQAMAHKISCEYGKTNTCSVMAWGYNPYITEASPYHGAYLAVIESVSKLIATGSSFKDVYLSFQEYFERLNQKEEAWGKPLSALLGAYKAQMDLNIAAIGGKDSMSGSFEDIHVPPTLVSFAVSTDKIDNIISPEFKEAGHKVFLLKPDYDKNGLPIAESLLEIYTKVSTLLREKKAVACYTPGFGGLAEAIMKMSFGNNFGFKFNSNISIKELFDYAYGSFVLETTDEIDNAIYIGGITKNKEFSYKNESLCTKELLLAYENKLEKIYACNIKQGNNKEVKNFNYEAKSWPTTMLKVKKPKVLIPVFPGTNCEYDSAKKFDEVGGQSKIFVINNLSQKGIKDSIDTFSNEIANSQIIFIPGGFSGGDEPDGSGKFIKAFFKNSEISKQVTKLLDQREGLMGGICNGFQALIKLGLVPYGKIIDVDENCPTLTFNEISRHQSRVVQTKISSNKSPWLSYLKTGDIINTVISNGEGRFLASEDSIAKLAENGQIATQYVNLHGEPTLDIHYNVNNSMHAIEGITSPDGRIFGKMGHAERIGDGLYKNVTGNYDYKMFEAAINYFK